MQKEYTQTKEQVLEGLRTDRQGLSAQEAEKRLREHGENRLKEAEKLTLFQRFVQQLKDPMLLILLAAAAVSAVTNIPVFRFAHSSGRQQGVFANQSVVIY